MTRLSSDQYEEHDGQFRLINGYDYVNQAWVIDGVYSDCGHPKPGETIPARTDTGYNPSTGRIEMLQIPAQVFEGCNCYGRLHEGTEPEPGLLDGSV